MPLGASVTSPALSEAQSQLGQTEENYTRTQRELQRLMQMRARTPMSTEQFNQSGREITALQQHERQLEEKIHRLEDLVARQQATIRTQSAAISNPRQYYPATNATPGGFGDTQTYGTMHGRNQSQQMLPPPPPPMFNQGTPSNLGQQSQPHAHMPSVYDRGPQQGIPQTPYGHSRSQTFGTPMTRQPGSQQPLPLGLGQHGQISVNQFGSPEPLRPFNNAGRHVPPQTPQVGSRGQGYQTSANRNAQSTPSSQAVQQPTFNDNTMALVKIPEGSGTTSVKEQFEKVWTMAERYCWAHVNYPSTHKDANLPKAIKDRLLRTAAPTQAFPLMTTPLTRYLMVTKVVVQWIMKNILKHDSFRGFDPEVDAAIEASKNQIYQCTCPLLLPDFHLLT